MKYTIIITIFCISIGYNCSNKANISEERELSNLELSISDKQIINELKKYISERAQISRSEKPDIIETSINNSDNYNLKLYPLYEFDQDAFYEDPSPEALIRAIKESSHRKIYMGTNKNGDKSDMIKIEAKMQEGNWIPYMAAYDWGKVIKRFENRSLQKFNLQRIKIFEFGFQEYILFNINEKNAIYNIKGEKQDLNTLCDRFLDIINTLKEWDGNPLHLRPI